MNKLHHFLISFCLVTIMLFSFAKAQTLSDNIHLNQVGFFCDGVKHAIAIDFTETTFEIWTSDLSSKIYAGTLSVRNSMVSSCETNIKMADFSSVKKEGEYVIVIGISKSYPFKILSNVYDDVAKTQMKYFYYNRSGMELKPEYAGVWARKAGHANTKVIVYDAQTRNLSMPGGWYDAGDYGLYMVTGSMAATQIMMAYEQFPAYWDKTEWNIPESGNGVPDILDEVKYELKWMYNMRDPINNGVFYKATPKTHPGFLMPDKDLSQYYCFVKNATSAYDYAATFALAARIYKKYETQFPGYADSCLNTAKDEWTWALSVEKSRPSCTNPSGVTTGAYTDNVANNDNDNKIVAGVELFLTTGDSTYLIPVLSIAQSRGFAVGEAIWSDKRPIACMELALHGDSIAVKSVLGYANTQLQMQLVNGYNVNIGSANADFNWGSSRRISNRGMALMVAYIISKEKKYLDGVVNSMDYVLGRNATGFSFITGLGTKKAMDPHHRISDSDGITDPQPGLPIQGPYDGSLGACTPDIVSTCRAKNYLDNSCSYVCNEISIDQASPHVFNFGGLMYFLGKQVIVDITSPVNDAIYKKDSSVVINVNALSKNGDVIKVKFYANSIFINEDTIAPYSFKWDNAPSSIYTIRAVAFDVINDSADAQINITVGNSAPRLSIDSPADNFYVLPNSPVTIKASAIDLDGIITKMRFYLNDSLIFSDTLSPYECTTGALATGKYIVKVIAYDNGDSTDTKQIIVNSACTNYIVNGEFNNNKNGWSLQLSDVAIASSTTASGGLSGALAYKLALTKAGSADSSIIVQQDLPMFKDKKYYFSYMMKSDQPSFVKFLIKKNTPPFETYFLKSDSVSSTPKMINFNYTANTTDEFSKINFYLGNGVDVNTFYLDKVFASECMPDSSVMFVILKDVSLSMARFDTVKESVITVPQLTVMPKLIWTSSDTSVATVDSIGTIISKNTGKSTITAALASKTTIKDMLTIDVQAVSINEIDNLNVVVNPTLVNNYITVYNADKLNIIQIMNSIGQIVESIVPANQEQRINCYSLSNGIYIIKLSAGKNDIFTKNIKIVKY